MIVRKIVGTRAVLGQLTNGRAEPFANEGKVGDSGALWIGQGEGRLFRNRVDSTGCRFGGYF